MGAVQPALYALYCRQHAVQPAVDSSVDCTAAAGGAGCRLHVAVHAAVQNAK